MHTRREKLEHFLENMRLGRINKKRREEIGSEPKDKGKTQREINYELRQLHEEVAQNKKEEIVENFSKITKYERHPYAEFIPPMNAKEIKALETDIAKNGLRDPIVIHEERIIDGWERYNACIIVGKPAEFIPLDKGENPFDFVRRKNKTWRSLNATRKGVCAAEEYLTRKASEPPIGGKTVGETAKDWDASPRSTERAVSILPKAILEIKTALKAGRVTLGWTEEVVKLSPQEQAEKLRERNESIGRTKASKKSSWDVLDPVTRIEIELTFSQVQATQERMKAEGCADMNEFVLQAYLKAIGENVLSP